MRRVLALAGVVLAAAGCRGDQGPRAGELSVRLAVARPTDRAIVFRVIGPLHAVTLPAGAAYRVFADTSANGDTARVVVVAAPGGGLAAGELARIRVDDTRKAASYVVKALDAATLSYQNGDSTGIVLTVVRP